jgi:hypothetical protein
MKALISAVCCLTLACTPLAFAQDKKEPTAAQKKQQARMKDCSKEAGDKNVKGDERKAFMSSCLKGGSEKMTAQQNKMKDCNKQAGDKNMKGEERKKFMSACLKG